jgi:3-phenylpropionate/trans-cinnamate dioxygenase ferredoxin subunit|tara:strand:- start:199 stop:504 length:306 start_codon:yes stop_codon:yes gene_type:complete
MIFVCKADEITNGQCKSFNLDEHRYLISNVNDTYFSIEDVCTHDGEQLSGGKLLGNQISCPRHGALFDVTTGKVKSLPALYDVKSFPVVNKAGDLYIEIDT